MKRLYLILIALAALLLTGCGSARYEKQFADFSAALREKTELSFSADVRAEYADHTAGFSFRYAGNANECAVTIRKPEILAGVTLHYKDGKSTLDYGSISIDTGVLDEDGLTPASSLPLLVKAFTVGHLDSCYKEDGEIVWHVIPSDGRDVFLWVDGETLVPTHAELAVGGRTVIFCDISDWN